MCTKIKFYIYWVKIGWKKGIQPTNLWRWIRLVSFSWWVVQTWITTQFNQKKYLQMSISLISFLFFLENFNLWHMLLIITLYHQSKTPMSFYYKRRLNLRSLIQLSETLSVELTGTYQNQLISWLNGKEQAYIRSKNHRFQVYHYLKKKKKE